MKNKMTSKKIEKELLSTIEELLNLLNPKPNKKKKKAVKNAAKKVSNLLLKTIQQELDKKDARIKKVASVKPPIQTKKIETVVKKAAIKAPAKKAAPKRRTIKKKTVNKVINTSNPSVKKAAV